MRGKKPTIHSKALRAALGAVAGLAVAGFASAPAAAQEVGVLEEIVVTAQKREQPAPDVPVSITVFTTSQLEGLDLEGKVALVLRYEPQERDEDSIFAGRMPSRWSALSKR